MNFEFEVDQFKTDPATGYTRIIIRYNLGKTPDVDERGFDCPEKAKYYIDSMKRDWLSRMFNKYVKASRIIFEKTPHMGYYNEQARLNSLQRCINGGLIIAQERSTKVVASYIVSSSKLLKHILPHPHNNSFNTSLERLNTMLQVANQYLQTHKTELSCS